MAPADSPKAGSAPKSGSLQVRPTLPRPIELIPGRLAWAPERFSPLDAMAGGGAGQCQASWKHVSALDFCGEQGSKYQVHHYTIKSQGRAFGPLGVLQTVAFSANLHKALASSESKGEGLELRTMPRDTEAHTNATVLVGAYLILGRGWTVQRTVDAMGQAEAQRKFVCSWSRQDKPEGLRIMEVIDCWEGLELAKVQGWLPQDIVTDEIKRNLWKSSYRRMLSAYDACWLAPGSLLISADPTTTACDPNPATFSSVFPGAKSPEPERRTSKTFQESEKGTLDGDDIVPLSLGIQNDGPGSEASSRTVSPPAVDLPNQSIDIDDDACSTDTVCKDYTTTADHVWVRQSTCDSTSSTGRPVDFVTFLRDCKISLVIRTNFANEPGMTTAYNGQEMLKHDIQHTDVSVDDHRGGLPGRQDIEMVIEEASDYMRKEGDGCLVHCKGGFGRSVVLACCILIDRLNVPGAALLGWARMCRPGAVTTPKQELFLRSMRGRDDLRRFISAGAAGGSPQPACGCTLM